MNKQHDKLLTDLHRLLDSQTFESEDEIKKFIGSFMNQSIPSMPKHALNNTQIAQDLVFEAYDLPPSSGVLKVSDALELDPDCIEAYEYLGSIEQKAEIAKVFFEKGIAIGRRRFGGKYMKENKGKFWGIHETRPFMRCLQQYSGCLYSTGKVNECVDVMQELIKLNPNDNQGVRDLLLLYLIELNEDKKFFKYAKQFGDEPTAFSMFNQALFSFKTEGETKNSNRKLEYAVKHNKFVLKKLLSDKLRDKLPDQYGFGDENEAKYYVFYAYHIWRKIFGAVKWLREFDKRA